MFTLESDSDIEKVRQMSSINCSRNGYKTHFRNPSVSISRVSNVNTLLRGKDNDAGSTVISQGK